MKQSESIATIAEALATFNLEVENPLKTKAGEGGRYRFSDLATLTALVRPLLAAAGISVIQEILTEENRAGAKTLLLHMSGEFIEFEPVYIPHSRHPQDIGSAITYARRYSLQAALGIAPEDDDDGARAQAGFVEQPQPYEPPALPRAHPSLVKRIQELRHQAGVTDDDYATELAKYGVKSDIDLLQHQAIELKRSLEDHLKNTEQGA